MNPKLIMIAHENLKINKQEFYVKDGEKHFLDKDFSHVLYENKNTFSCTVEPKEEVNISKSKNKVFATIQVVKEGSVDAIIRFGKIYPKNTVGVLNFASAKHPGGGFLTGSIAQEECLCYCSNLYNNLLGQKYYKINDTEKSVYYSDAMVVSLTAFYRDSQYHFLDTPINTLVVSCPAVNRNIALNRTMANIKMKERMERILKTFILYDQKNIILGAFGCGVFKNDANDIAQIWKELIIDEEYGKYFTNISFSVLGDKNYKSFEKIFLNN